MMLIARILAAALLLGTLGGRANAQTDPSADPPGRVARLSEFTGQVWLYNADSGSEWVSAVRNRPVAAGDRLATEPGARAELQLGSTTVRLDSNTELEVSALDDERLSLQLVSGSATAHVVDLAGAGQFDLSTDEGRFMVQRAGSYRFDRDGNASRVTVYSGLARYEGPNSGLPVAAGQRGEFWIDSGGVAQYTMSAPVNDAFSAWSNDRDRRSVVGVSARYVSPEMTGAEELDRYGRWEQNPEYGALWIPTAVAVDWAPYRTGHWAWVRPWGWTWVDDAPWGFAPFHYGRWVNVRNNWCWTPGARVARPVYAPALVAWVGGPRANVSITIGGGPAVGWFPLAPREVYVPSYRVSQRYAQNINITHVTNVTVINNVFANPQGHRDFDNRRFQNAITVVPTAVMTSRQPVAPAAAQMRRDPAWSRDIANQPARGAVTLLAPPVAAPQIRSGVDPRNVRPPPGFAERPASPRPGIPERDRDGRGRDVGRPEGPRPTPPVALQQPAPAAPVVNPGAPSPVARPIPPNAGERRDIVPPPPGRNEDRRRGGDRNEAAPPAAAPAVAPRPAAPAPQGQEAPMMRAQPVRRGEDRPAPPKPEAAPNEPRPQVQVQEAPMMRAQPVRRGEDRPAPPTPEAAPNEPRQQAPRFERPNLPAPAAVPAPRPVEPPRPVEVPRPAPAAAPVVPAAEARRPEQRPPRAESPVTEQKRGERDPRDQQR